MKVQLISDVHGRFNNIIWNKNADIVLAAGDISENIYKAVDFLKTSPVPVFYIAGNHEFYGDDINKVLNTLRELCDSTNGKVNFLEKECFEIDNVRLLGTTLWSNYDDFDPLLVDSSEGFINDFFNIKAGSYNNNTDWNQDIKELNDSHQKLRRSLYLQGGKNKDIIEYLYSERIKILKSKKINITEESFLLNRFSAALVYLFNKESIYWLESELLEKHNGSTIVMTHHAPSKLPLSLSNFVVNIHGKSLKPFINNEIVMSKIGTYTNSLDGLISRTNISHWVHGHFHNKMLYKIGETQIHCNPVGYKKNDILYTGYNSYTFETDLDKGNALKNNVNHFIYIIKGIINYILYLKNDNNLKYLFNDFYLLQSLIDEINVNISPLLSLHGEHNKFLHLKNPLLEMINMNKELDMDFIYILTDEFLDYLSSILKILKNMK